VDVQDVCEWGLAGPSNYKFLGMRIGPYHLIDITTKTFNFYLKYGPKTPIFGTLIYDGFEKSLL
jgi:hypothetical protein